MSDARQERQERQYERDSKKAREEVGEGVFISPGESLLIEKEKPHFQSTASTTTSTTAPHESASQRQGKDKGEGREGKERSSTRQFKKRQGECQVFTWYAASDSHSVQKKKLEEHLENLEKSHATMEREVKSLEAELRETRDGNLQKEISIEISEVRQEFARIELKLKCLLEQMLLFYHTTEAKCAKKKTRKECTRDSQCLWIPADWSWSVTRIWAKLTGDPGVCRSLEKYELGLKYAEESVSSLAELFKRKAELEDKVANKTILWSEKHELQKLRFESENRNKELKRHIPLVKSYVDETKKFERLTEKLKICRTQTEPEEGDEDKGESEEKNEQDCEQLESAIRKSHARLDKFKGKWKTKFKGMEWKQIFYIVIAVALYYMYGKHLEAGMKIAEEARKKAEADARREESRIKTVPFDKQISDNQSVNSKTALMLTAAGGAGFLCAKSGAALSVLFGSFTFGTGAVAGGALTGALCPVVALAAGASVYAKTF